MIIKRHQDFSKNFNAKKVCIDYFVSCFHILYFLFDFLWRSKVYPLYLVELAFKVDDLGKTFLASLLNLVTLLLDCWSSLPDRFGVAEHLFLLNTVVLL